VQLLYESAAMSQWFSLVVATILAGTQWGAVAPAVLLPWVVCLALISIGRLVSVAIYRRASNPDPERWYRQFFVAAGCSGLAWGCAALFLAGTSSSEQQVVVMLMLAGMVAAAVPYLAIAPRIYYLFALLTFGPVVAVFFGRPGPSNAGLGAVGAVYLIGMLSAARRINRYMVSSLNLRRENEGLVGVLQEANARMEASNAALTAEIGERARRARLAFHGQPRSPHCAAQPLHVLAPPAGSHAARPSPRQQARGAVHRPGPLQGHQRHPGPPCGRPPAHRGRGAPVARHAQDRQPRAPGRR
jgi:hypothetical protein